MREAYIVAYGRSAAAKAKTVPYSMKDPMMLPQRSLKVFWIA